VLAVPNAALRTQRDVASAARCWARSERRSAELAAANRPQQTPANRDSASLGGGAAKPDSAKPAPAGTRMTTPDGRTSSCRGRDRSADQIGFPETHVGPGADAAEQSAMAAMRQMMQRAGGGAGLVRRSVPP